MDKVIDVSVSSGSHDRVSAFERAAARTAERLNRMQRDAERLVSRQRTAGLTAAEILAVNGATGPEGVRRAYLSIAHSLFGSPKRKLLLRAISAADATATVGGLPRCGSVDVVTALVSAGVVDPFSATGASRSFWASGVGEAHFSASSRVLETWWFARAWADLAGQFFRSVGERVVRQFEGLARSGSLWRSVQVVFLRFDDEPRERGSSAAVRTNPERPNAPPPLPFREPLAEQTRLAA